MRIVSDGQSLTVMNAIWPRFLAFVNMAYGFINLNFMQSNQ